MPLSATGDGACNAYMIDGEISNPAPKRTVAVVCRWQHR